MEGSRNLGDNFCIQWKDFGTNISRGLQDLRKEKEFFDVTLCCDNGIDKIKAHKLILASCSPLFKRILANNKERPLLYLKGVNKKELSAVLGFMYNGEVNVAEDSLTVFLAVAEELSIKGLATNISSTDSSIKNVSNGTNPNSAEYDEQVKQSFLSGNPQPMVNDTDKKDPNLSDEDDESDDDDAPDPVQYQQVFQANINNDNYEKASSNIMDQSNAIKKNNKAYYQSFRDEWLNDPEFETWLQKDPTDVRKAFCTLCQKMMKAKHSGLMDHSKSELHKKNVGALTTMIQITEQPNGNNIHEMIRLSQANGNIFPGNIIRPNITTEYVVKTELQNANMEYM